MTYTSYMLYAYMEGLDIQTSRTTPPGVQRVQEGKREEFHRAAG